MSIVYRTLTVLLTLLCIVVTQSTIAQPADKPDDANWSGIFGAPGMGNGGSSAYVANDLLYLFGFIPVLQNPGGFDRALFATWDGEVWGGRNVFGTFLQNEFMNDALIIGSDLYVGGQFSNIDGNGTANIARWDGEKWNPLGLGVNGRVNAMATDGNGNIYVGGDFTEAGGQPARNVAVWNGSSWAPLPNPGGANDGVGSRVTAIAVSNSHVYVGGAFQEAGSEAAVSIASWNWTTSEWRGLGGGLRRNGFPNAGITAIGAANGKVYVGGDFDFAGNSGGEIAVNNIAVFDGSQWSPLGVGSSESVTAMLVTGGGRVFINGTPNGVAEWTGTNWEQLNQNEYSYNVTDIVEYRGDPIAISGANPFGGTSGSVITNGVGRWDGTHWRGLGSGVGAFGVDTWFVFAVEEHEGVLYAGGLFEWAGDGQMRNIGGWDGTDWSDLGAGLVDGSRIYDLESTPLGLIVGGSFSQIGGVTTSSVALWDGSNWQAMGEGLSVSTVLEGVEDVDYVDGTIYVAGHFRRSGSDDVRGLARWTGSAWEPVGGGVSSALTMAVSGPNVYVGTTGTSIGVNYDPVTNRFGQAVGNVAHWDGTQWNDPDGGVCCGSDVFRTGVRAAAMQGTDLIVGGDFTQAGSTPAKNIARWDGSAWHAIGGGIDGVVTAIHVNGPDIYAGGTFTTASGQTVNSVARWDGSAWTGLGSGLYLYLTFNAMSTVSDFSATSDGLAMGGRFSFAGPTPSNNVAVWTDYSPVGGVAVVQEELPRQTRLLQNYPNPFNLSTTIEFELASTTDVRLTVVDLLGREVGLVTSGPLPSGTHSVVFDAAGLSGGLYLYRLNAGTYTHTQRMIIVK